MKKAILIFSILLSAVLVWYLYEDNSPEPTEKVEELSKLEKELNFYREYAALTGHNTKYAWRLFDAGKERLKNGDYYGAEAYFKEYETIKISQWWLSDSTHPYLTNLYNKYLYEIGMKYAWIYEKTGRIEEALNIYLENGMPIKAAKIYRNTGRVEEELEVYLENDMPMYAVKIYEKTDRIEKALNLLLNKKDSYLKGLDCGTCSLSYQSSTNKKLIEFCFKLQKFDTAFTVYMDNINFIHGISDDSLNTIINAKLSKYSYVQRDSILNAAYKSIEVRKKEEDRYSTQFEIFDKEIYNSINTGNVEKVKNKAQAKQYAWNDFKRTRLYQLLAERPDK